MNDVDLVAMWEIPVELNGHKISKALILAAADGQLCRSVNHKELVVMVELNPLFYEGAPQRVEAKLSLVHQIQEERIAAIESQRGKELSYQERLALIRQIPKEDTNGRSTDS